MKRFIKALKVLGIISLTLILTTSVALMLIIEPKIKINGFTSLDKEKLSVFTRSINVCDLNGNTIQGAIYDKNRIYTPLKTLNQHTIDAFICVEDKRFYSHNGFDLIRILSAMKNNVLSGKYAEGASTISQQLIKNTHLNNKKTIKRKLQEIRIARELERNYTKDEILEMYLNSLYFGNGLYGIGSASSAYFGVNASELTLSQSAVLASIINSPGKYDIYKNYENAINRRNSILRRMFEQGKITNTDYQTAINEKITPAKNSLYSNQFINATINDASTKLYVDAEALYWGDNTIKTYCDSELQNKIQKIIANYDNENYDITVLVSKNSDNTYRTYVSNSQTDITGLLRQPGSTIKPFVCFAPALEYKHVYLCTPILDERTDFDGYMPQNYNNKHYGWTSVENSLVHSLNVPAVKLMEVVGIENAINFARKFAINLSNKDKGLATALGGITNGLSLQTLVDAYQTFANGGKFNKGKFINEIIDKNGKTLYKDLNQHQNQIIGEDTAQLINHALNTCVTSGTAKKLGYTHKNLCAKTGTVGGRDGNTDAYCISYSPTYTVGVRISCNNEVMDNSITGGGKCAEISNDIWNLLNDGYTFSAGSEIIYKDIDLREYSQNHKVMLAGEETLEINRKTEIFSIKNMPKTYSSPSAYTEKKSILDDFDDFKIVNGFLD